MQATWYCLCLVLDEINKQPRLANNPYVFSVPRGEGYYHSWSDGMEALRKALPDDVAPFVLHDLRRTWRSLASKVRVQPHIAERVLGLALVGFEGVYDRYAYKDEKAYACAAVASYVGNIIRPTQVVRISERM